MAPRVCIQKIPSGDYFYWRGTIFSPTNTIEGGYRMCWSLLNGKRFRQHQFSVGSTVEHLTPKQVQKEKGRWQIMEG